MSKSSNIPFLDLVTQHLQLEEELVSVFRSALKTAGFIGGPMVEDFERDFAKFCDTKYSVGVSSGTDALRFALSAAGVGEGDVVVTVPNTFIATTEAISQTGALADFVDVDERTYNMDPAKLQRFFETQCQLDQKSGVLLHRQTGRKVKAIVPVHLYGQMADMDPILALAEKYNLIVIEDACQAHGAEYFSKKEKRWRKAGSIGLAAAFSFYPGKNLGACGEAGAVTTNDEALARKVKMIRDHGQAKKYYHDVEGYNGRLDAIQAGFLSVKLKHLADWNKTRRATAVAYGELFGASTLNWYCLIRRITPSRLSLVCGPHRGPRTIENHACRCRHWDGHSLSRSSAYAGCLSGAGIQSRGFSGDRTGGVGNPVVADVSRVETRRPEPHCHRNQKTCSPIADQWPQPQGIRYDSIGVMNYWESSSVSPRGCTYGT